MNSVWVLYGIALLPLVPLFFWFRHKKYGAFKFLLPAAAGILTVLITGFVQNFLPLHLPGQNAMKDLLFSVFVRVSLMEELIRLLVLFLLFSFFPAVKILNQEKDLSLFFGAPSGLAAGLGFAAGESVFYGLLDPGAALLRLVTAVPIHAACGARIGSGLGQLRSHPVGGIVLFVTAYLIHAVYDLCIQNPVVPEFLSVFIALAALATSLFNIFYGIQPAQNRKPL
ncbi:MAG: PrsW family glutamic-type intramembrane protease [Treponema sp.]|nr:PrsW family glutamic-type intramembrane protease [Treponema sp.]